MWMSSLHSGIFLFTVVFVGLLAEYSLCLDIERDKSGAYNDPKCSQVQFTTAIRVSEYFGNSLSSRNGLLSYRLFQNTHSAYKDLVVAIIIDQLLSADEKEYLQRELFNIEARFVFVPTSSRNPSGLDSAPLYWHALHALRLTGSSDACSVMYLNANSLFIKDPSQFILEYTRAQSPTIHCTPHTPSEPENFVMSKLVDAFGLPPGSIVQPYNGLHSVSQMTCGSEMVFFSNAEVVGELLDTTARLVSAAQYFRFMQPQVSPLDNSLLSDDLISDLFLRASLYSIEKSNGFEGTKMVGYLPVFAETALVDDGGIIPEGNNLGNSSSLLREVYIVVHPQPPQLSSRRAAINFVTAPEGGGCTVDLLPWTELIGRVDEQKYWQLGESLVQRIKDTPYSCELLSGSLSVIPNTDYLEIGTTSLSERTHPWHMGLSNVGYALDTNKITRRLTFQEMVESFLSRRGRHPSLIRIKLGKWDANNISLGSDEELDWFTEFIARYESIPGPQRHMTERFPCVILIESSQDMRVRNRSDVADLNRDFETSLCSFILKAYGSRLYKLGLLPIDNLCTSHPKEFLALGPHCASRYFDRLMPLLPCHITNYFPVQKNSLNTRNVGDARDESKYQFYTTAPLVFPNGSDTEQIGLLVADVPGQEFQLIENPIRDDMLVDLLIGRLMHKTFVQSNPGANSYFIRFDGSGPRSLIESFILEHLAPVVVGPLDVAIKNGFIGAEWWTQQRAEDDPKEYHMDTAITWCRDNGWPTELLSSCHFYPAIGSVVYLTDEGGPTAVFNQTPSEYGLSPFLPAEIALVFPKRNRMMLFNGAKFHGVMRRKPCDASFGQVCLPRVTLLVNYWRDKVAGESYTMTLPQEELYMSRYSNIMNALKKDEQDRRAAQDQNRDSGAVYSATLKELSLNRTFRQDFLDWRSQRVPAEYMNLIARTFENFSYSDGEHSFYASNSGDGAANFSDRNETILMRTPAVLVRLDRDDAVNEYATSLKRHIHNWPSWIHDDHQNLVLNQVMADPEDLRVWREMMPGGNPFVSKGK